MQLIVLAKKKKLYISVLFQKSLQLVDTNHL